MLQLIGKLAAPALIVALLGYAFYVYKKVSNQQIKNRIEDIDLTIKKIELENNSIPIESLVDKSNQEHGAAQLGQAAGVDPKKGE